MYVCRLQDYMELVFSFHLYVDSRELQVPWFMLQAALPPGHLASLKQLSFPHLFLLTTVWTLLDLFPLQERVPTDLSSDPQTAYSIYMLLINVNIPNCGGICL